MPGRPAQPVCGALAAEHEVDRRQRDVDRGPRGRVGARHDVRGRVERPVAGPPVRVARSRASTSATSPRSRRGSGSSPARGSRTASRRDRVVPRGPRKRSRPGSWTARDRLGAVLRGRDELEPAVRRERGADPLRALGDLVRRDLDAHHRLGPDVVGAGAAGGRRRAWLRDASRAGRAPRRRSRGSRRRRRRGGSASGCGATHGKPATRIGPGPRSRPRVRRATQLRQRASGSPPPSATSAPTGAATAATPRGRIPPEHRAHDRLDDVRPHRPDHVPGGRLDDAVTCRPLLVGVPRRRGRSRAGRRARRRSSAAPRAARRGRAGTRRRPRRS